MALSKFWPAGDRFPHLAVQPLPLGEALLLVAAVPQRVMPIQPHLPVAAGSAWHLQRG